MDLVFVDANVLYSKTLRDWTLMLAQECNRFAVVSSQDCVIEALANLREQIPAADGGVIRQIGKSIEGALHDIIDDWPGGEIEGMPDEKDWHVVHAATHAQVKILVTDNMKDFAPVAESLPFDLYTPDELFTLVAENDPQAVAAVTRRQVEYWTQMEQRHANVGRPAPKRLGEALRDAGALEFADIIEDVLRELSGIRHQDSVAMADAPTSEGQTTNAASASLEADATEEPSRTPAP
ncbi:PIN domain-containing protein [Agromyces salentinus]|nr:PIN domain-containing protein [Agromyces salentinus]